MKSGTRRAGKYEYDSKTNGYVLKEINSTVSCKLGKITNILTVTLFTTG
jgi:hypothetical protein